VTFAQLRAFVTIARCGSVKAAALEMKVSQAAMSQAIFGLRAEFDDELYVRDGRGVSLTPRGRQLAGIGADPKRHGPPGVAAGPSRGRIDGGLPR